MDPNSGNSWSGPVHDTFWASRGENRCEDDHFARLCVHDIWSVPDLLHYPVQHGSDHSDLWVHVWVWHSSSICPTHGSGYEVVSKKEGAGEWDHSWRVWDGSIYIQHSSDNLPEPSKPQS